MNKQLFLFLFSLAFIYSCGVKEKIAPSGMKYIIRNESSSGGNLIKEGQYVKLNLEYKLKSNDSILSTSYGKTPIYLPVNKNTIFERYTIGEIITSCKKGDNVTFTLSIDSLVKYNKIEINRIFRSSDLIIGRVEILDVFSSIDLVEADYKIELKKSSNNTSTKLQTPEDIYFSLSGNDKIEYCKKQLKSSNLIITDKFDIPIPDNTIFYIISDSLLLDSSKTKDRYNFPIVVRFSDRKVSYSGNRFEDGGLDRKSVGAAYDYGKYGGEGITRDIQIYESDYETGKKFIPVQIGYVTNNLGRFEIFDFKNMKQLDGLPKYYSDIYDILDYLGKISDDISNGKINMDNNKNFLFYNYGGISDKFNGIKLNKRK